ncbi:MAG TPA: ABC transporter ATP-binding protein [Pilimelia sp.]|nr:ABC transporter ATP-binding protein [Pilimelia sp.]
MAEQRTAPPTVIVDDLHVVYRVRVAAGERTTPATAVRRLVRRQRPPGVREVHAVRGVSLVAYQGQAIGLIGGNGSGKSTLLRAIAGLLPAERGAVFTRGQPSLLGVNAALKTDLTGERNVVLGCLAMGMTAAEAAAVMPGIIEFSGINERGDFAALPMRTYSAGMAARLRFAIAVARTHDVLLVDEALATGDAGFQQRALRRMAELRRQAGTLFLVSHDNRSIRDSCERCIWLDDGAIRLAGPTAEVLAAYEAETRRG